MVWEQTFKVDSVNVSCNKCGHKFSVDPDFSREGTSSGWNCGSYDSMELWVSTPDACPKCNESNFIGESFVEEF